MKPKAPQLTPENAARFQEQGVADVYHLRLPHPEGIFTTLESLMPNGSRAILDVGTGTGDLARRMTAFAARVDAVDVSAPMLAKGRSAPGGDHPDLNWMHGRVEDTDFQPPYGLITGGDSIHWMDWDIVFPKFHEMLVPSGFVAIVGRVEEPEPWEDELRALIPKYSVYREFQSYSLIEVLVERGHFQKVGDYRTPLETNRQSVDDYILSWHSRGGLARETMPEEHIVAFDTAVRELVMPYAVDGTLTLQTEGRVTWGKPLK
jgi:trans-aconitate methyltransferase